MTAQPHARDAQDPMSTAAGVRSPRRVVAATAVVIGAVLVLLIAVLATRDSATDRLARSPLLFKAAPAIEGEVVVGEGAGGPFRLQDLAGKWVVLNFFASWCVPCQREHPELVRFAEAHRTAGDVQLVAVMFGGEPRSDVQKFFDERGGDWPVVFEPRAVVSYGVVKLPETFLVSPQGQIVVKFVGQVTEKGLERRLREAKAAYNRA